ncbi:MAG: hypothetical protein FWC79_06920 [Oscillospiraceae bacterium]|nr:hypothetical protein [Oscillospiraceae bacterium]
MSQTKPSTKDLLEILKQVDLPELLELLERVSKDLHKKSERYDLVDGIVTEVAVFATGFSINKISMMLLGTVVISNPLLFAVAVGSGILAMNYTRLQAIAQRRMLYRKYGIASYHINHVIEILYEINKSKNK